jgi:hypothetical protein
MNCYKDTTVISHNEAVDDIMMQMIKLTADILGRLPVKLAPERLTIN